MNKAVVKVTAALLLTTMVSVSLFQPVFAAEDSDILDEETSRSEEESSQSEDEPSRAEDESSRSDRSDEESRATRTTSASSSTASGGYDFTPSKKYAYSGIQSKIKEYQKTNSDVKGWLTIPGTNINEPIVYYASNNSHYVNRDWKGTNYPNNNWTNFVTTATYADCRTRWGSSWSNTSKNTVLYGHNWTNLRDPMDIGSNNNHIMFGQLPSYTDATFAANNPYIYYSTGENEGIWKVFSVTYCELKPSFFYNSPNPSPENYDALLKEWKSRSMLDFDVDVNTNDRILTLSTCTRVYSNMGDKQRYVVVARLLRDGESENDTVKVTSNPNWKRPQF